MNINTIKDTVKALAQSLQVTTILPASLLAFVNLYLILPRMLPDFDPTSPPVVTLTVSLTLMFSYALYAFNFPLIRLLEGYKLKETDLSHWLLRREQQGFESLRGRIRALRKERALLENDLGFNPDEDDTGELSEEDAECWRSLSDQLADLEYRLDRRYPSSTNRVLPTGLGNTIAAFEDYARTRYGMDTVALWPRLVPVLKELKYSDFVTQEKSVFDFLLNTFVAVIVLGVELVYVNLFLGHPVRSLVAGVATLLTAYVLFNGIVVAARQWGTTVRVAFDLYRHNLSRRLGLLPAGSFEEEYRRWQEVSSFLLFRRKRVWFDGFIPQDKLENRGKPEGGT